MQTILLIAANATLLAEAIRRDLDLPVTLAPTRRIALAALRQSTFDLILLDESLAESLATLDPEGADLLYEAAGAALILELNFAITSAPRALRQVRAAIARRTHDRATAHRAATASLQNELNASITGLLLESQLALREASPAQAAKLRHVVALAGDLRNRLRL